MADFTTDGYEVISDLFSPDEVAEWQAEARRLYRDADLMALDSDRTVTRATTAGGNQVDRLDPVVDVSPVFRRLAEDERILAVASRCLGGPVRLFKDKLIFKAPGVHGYQIHQDYTAWQEVGAPAHDIVSIMVAVDPATPENGAVEFYPGRHDRHLVEKPLDDDIFSASGCVIDAEVLADTPAQCAHAEAGDIVVIHSLVPHASSPNRTEHPRAAFFATYSHVRHGDLYGDYYARFRGYRRRSESIRVD